MGGGPSYLELGPTRHDGRRTVWGVLRVFWHASTWPEPSPEAAPWMLGLACVNGGVLHPHEAGYGWFTLKITPQ